MYAMHLPSEPPCDDWNDRDKPILINIKIQEICANIGKKGEKCSFPEIFDYLYEYIDNNIEKFLGE
jgi:hypothetical protein